MGFEGRPTGFISENKGSAPKDTTAPEGREKKETGSALEELIKQANTLGREGRDAALKTLSEQLAGCKDQLDPAIREKIFNPDGSPNLSRACGQLGYGPRFNNHLTTDGRVKPIEEVPKEKDEEETSGQKDLPDRPRNAPTGTQLFESWGLNRDVNSFPDELADKIIAEIEKGNVPDSVRNMSTISMRGTNGVKISFRTSNGYLAVGSNEDNIRVPLSGPMAKRIADHFGWALPTADMAMETDRKANLQLVVGGEQDISRMADLEWSVRHNKKAKQKLDKYLSDYNEKARQENRPTITAADLSKMLIRGEKKNIFIGRGATKNNGGVGIGGLLDGRGNPIQPYQYPHAGEIDINKRSGGHCDYSQDIARIDQTIEIAETDGTVKRMRLYDALRNPRYAAVLNASDYDANNNHTFDADLAYTSPEEKARILEQRKRRN